MWLFSRDRRLCSENISESVPTNTNPYGQTAKASTWHLVKASRAVLFSIWAAEISTVLHALPSN